MTEAETRILKEIQLKSSVGDHGAAAYRRSRRGNPGPRVERRSDQAGFVHDSIEGRCEYVHAILFVNTSSPAVFAVIHGCFSPNPDAHKRVHLREVFLLRDSLFDSAF